MRHITGPSHASWKTLSIGLVAAAAAVAARPASAQTLTQASSNIGVSAGVLTTGTMQGATFQVHAPLTPRFSVVGEVNRSRGRDCDDCGPVYNDTSVLAGVRVGAAKPRRVSAFGQVLVGGLHSVAGSYTDVYCCGIGPRTEPGYTIDYLAVQPGGGFTVRLTPRVALQTQADLQFAVPDQQQWEGASVFPRMTVGATVRLGRVR